MLSNERDIQNTHTIYNLLILFLAVKFSVVEAKRAVLVCIINFNSNNIQLIILGYFIYTSFPLEQGVFCPLLIKTGNFYFAGLSI